MIAPNGIPAAATYRLMAQGDSYDHSFNFASVSFFVIEMVSFQHETISTIIQQENGPIRKKKAEKAMADFTLTVNEDNLQNKMAA